MISKGFFILLLILLFNLNYVSALCEENQIDINTATVEELDKIIWVGSATAQNIINSRPFSSLDDLLKVTYIGEKKLEDIKSQGLACVNGETESEVEEIEEKEQVVKANEAYAEPIVAEISSPKDIELETINLNPKVIKSGDDMENPNKNNYAIYGFIFFSVLLGVLFIVRKNRYKKNEFA